MSGIFNKLTVNHKGIALISAYLVIAVLIVFAITFVNASIGQNNAASFFKYKIQAFDLADAGLDKALVQLRAGSAAGFSGAFSPVGSYSVTITDLGLYGTMRRYKVVSQGTAGSITQTLINFLQVDNYARYIWFTDGENYGNTNVWFWNQDHLNGPVHSNDQLNIAGNNPGPIFDGVVESVNDKINYYNNGYNKTSSDTSNSPYDTPAFNAGITLGADTIKMPTKATYLRSAASSGLSLSGNTTVVLKSDGTMTVTNSKKGWSSKNMSLPGNGALFVDGGTLTISGTLSGRLTAGSSGDIIISSSILYADDPRTNSSSTDMLGLISESDVVISASASYNLEIDASIMALSTSFLLENYWTGSAKGTLTVYGGIIQDQRGPVGTFNGVSGQKLTGYSKSYSYDSRMLTSPPPFYPTTGDYISLVWQED